MHTNICVVSFATTYFYLEQMNAKQNRKNSFKKIFMLH